MSSIFYINIISQNNGENGLAGEMRVTFLALQASTQALTNTRVDFVVPF
jgi:hypothetical protein